VLPTAALLAFGFAAACSRGGGDATGTPTAKAPDTMAISASPASPAASCGHVVCADNFFVDATSADCAAGAPCSVTLKVVATGDFHINDEYPYKFKADDTAGVDFLGTDAAGKTTFSKNAGDWQKAEEKVGAMNVKFTVADRGAKTIGGTLKLSVCSGASCLLEQRPVTASVVAK
jgi:hypothetical protein